MYKKQYKTAYYELLAKQGLSSVWLDKIISGGSRSRGVFLHPERLPMSFIVQLAYTARVPIEVCIETLWQHNIKDSPFFSNTEYKAAIPVVAPPSDARYNKGIIKPYSTWWPAHLRGSALAEITYERRYRPSDFDNFMRFPETGTFHWVRKPYTISRVQDFIRMSAFMGVSFNEALDFFLMIKTEPINIPLVLPVTKYRSKNQTIASMHTFDMLRLLKNINQL